MAAQVSGESRDTADHDTRVAEEDEASAPPLSSQSAALLTQYQRVGRALLALQKESGAEVAAELTAQFKSIRIDDATATAQTRAQCAATLAELETQIERRKAVRVSQECLDNPLAPECQ